LYHLAYVLLLFGNPRSRPQEFALVVLHSSKLAREQLAAPQSGEVNNS